jgi:hypothetical protein
MTMLGFGDITPYPKSYVGHVLVMAQVFLGEVRVRGGRRRGALGNSAGRHSREKWL